ncbi:MAG: 30S ribosomal protein S9 [bacterium]
MPEATKNSYVAAVGRRKSAVAQVRLISKGSGKIVINEKPFTGEEPAYVAPLKLVGKFGDLDLSVHVAGGGIHGQADAIQHGIARALLKIDEEFRTTLKKAGFLTRDPREKERKKPGLKSARRAPQWSKR